LQKVWLNFTSVWTCSQKKINRFVPDIRIFILLM
jgi:hypothetical protein